MGAGSLSGAPGADTGSYFNTGVSSFTGGTLAALFIPNSAGLSFALTGFNYGEGGSPFILDEFGNPIGLTPFTADGVGVIQGEPIPEPITAALLIPGLLAGYRIRRRQA